MKYVLFQNDRVVALAPSSPWTGTPQLKKFDGIEYNRVEDRWDWKTMEHAERIAMFVTAVTGRDHIAVDNGAHVSPRFDIVEPPKVGEAVSYAFNGDYYPCGTIERITKGGMVVTTEGKKFNRKGLSGSWIMVGGTWGLVKGHISEQNPHF
jgi:hypothetical protein